MSQDNGRPARLAGMVEATAVFLFFYQALRVLFSVLFGVIYDALFAGIVPMSTVGLLLGLVIVALLVPLAAPRPPKARRGALLVGALLVFLARFPLTLNIPQARLVAAVIIIAGTGLYLAASLRAGPGDVIRALILALVIDQLLRAAGHTFDVTLRPAWWSGQTLVSLLLCLLAARLFWRRQTEELGSGAGLGLLGGLAWGGWLFLQTSLLAFPNALARWSDMTYALVTSLLLCVTLLPLLEGGRWTVRWGRAGRVAISIALPGGLAAGYIVTGPLALLGLLVAQLAALLLLPACLSPPLEGKDRSRGALALGGVLFLILSFAYAFAFTYPYTLELFRDMGLSIVLAAGLLVALPALRKTTGVDPAKPLLQTRWAAVLGIVLVLLVTIWAWPHAAQPPLEGTPFKMATYNIHYGYDTDWHLNLEAQAQAIEASGASVVALQEVDAGRPTSYMIDDALWLSRRLGMEVVYLPCVEHLTGIALLSRYPVRDLETLLLPSELEQTGIIWAALDAGRAPVNAFAIWMGLEPEERARQLDAALPFVDAHPGPAGFGGDFNSTPGSPVYTRIAAAGFVDPFPALGLDSPPTSPAINPAERIDFVWLRDLVPATAQVLDSTASDHRLVVAGAVLP